MKRRKGLEPDPEKVRDWQRRSRDRALERQQKARPRRALRQGKRKSKARIPPKVRRRVLARNRGRCCRPGCGKRSGHVHHVLDEQHFPELALVEDNMVGTCPGCNWDHHFKPGGRLPRSAIPSRALRLAAEVGPRAEAHIERYYPRGPGPAAPGDGGQEEQDG